MTNATQFTPKFYETFQCIGALCEDNCCHGWRVHIDKKTYRNYVTHPDQLIQSTSKAHIKKTKQSDLMWAEIQLDDQGMCPFLNEGLCQIHQRAGAQALSHTCQTYPRITTRFADHHKLSLNLSCPQACRQILLDPDAMAMTTAPFAGFNKQQVISPAIQQLHLHTLDVLLTDGMTIEEQLWVIGLLIHRNDGELSNELFLNQIGQMVANQQLSTAFSQLPFISQLQWQALRNLTYLQLLNTQSGQIRGVTTMRQCLDQFQQFLTGEFSTEKLAQLHQVWHSEVANFLAPRPHILRNYLVYYVYHHNFPYQPNKSPQQSYQLLIADYYLLRSYLCLLAMAGKLTEQDLINLFYSYHSIRQHKPDFERTVGEVISQFGSDTELALYALLQTAVDQ